MLGAIAGDIVGSPYEGRSKQIKTERFPLFSHHSTFTDDSVMTVAVAYAILNKVDYAQAMRLFGRRYLNAGYGQAFFAWLTQDEIGPYNSWGNGSAMRVSPVGWAFESVDQVLVQAQRSAEVSHNHPEGIKGAQAVALAVFLARRGSSKAEIQQEVTARFGYDLEQSLSQIRPDYRFDVSCQGSVPQSIIAFLESSDVEDAIRKAVSLGGDSDTMACMAGAIAEAYYKTISQPIVSAVRQKLPADLLDVVEAFQEKYGRS